MSKKLHNQDFLCCLEHQQLCTVGIQIKTNEIFALYLFCFLTVAVFDCVLDCARGCLNVALMFLLRVGIWTGLVTATWTTQIKY